MKLQDTQFSDTEFLSAKEKEKVFRQWCIFLKKNFDRHSFSKALYQHLNLHCDFIAHYNLDGFWDYYFSEGRERETLRFLQHFDATTDRLDWFWLRDERYADLNQAMITELSHHSLRLEEMARSKYKVCRVRELELLASELGYSLYKASEILGVGTNPNPDCELCTGDGYYYEDVVGDGGTRERIICECVGECNYAGIETLRGGKG